VLFLQHHGLFDIVCPLYASNRAYVVFVGVQWAREGEVSDELVDHLMGILGICFEVSDYNI
jgi:hypothetical protein